MKSQSLLLMAALFTAIVAEAGDNEIKFKSPDGQFALQITPSQTSIVKLPGGDFVTKVDDMGRPFLAGKMLVWSADSHGVAYYGPDRRSGTVSIFVRKDGSFEFVDLPDLPEPKFSPKHTDDCPVVGHIERPVRWLSPRELVIYYELEDECGKKAAEEIILALDDNDKATIKKATAATVRQGNGN
jgi:hypothetical protein